MTPLDLTVAPPRSPRAVLRGLPMLPRMIDIARAMLPDGRVGDYQIGLGLSGVVLGKLKTDVAGFVAHVAAAADDAEVGVRVCGARPDCDFANVAALLSRLKVKEVPPELAAGFRAYYGEQLDPEQLIFDLLETDDAKLGRVSGG